MRPPPRVGREAFLAGLLPPLPPNHAPQLDEPAQLGVFLDSANWDVPGFARLMRERWGEQVGEGRAASMNGGQLSRIEVPYATQCGVTRSDSAPSVLGFALHGSQEP